LKQKIGSTVYKAQHEKSGMKEAQGMKQSGFLGVLMLDTAFPRPVGDIGNRNSFPDIPLRFARVANLKRALRVCFHPS
jgi:hypothetical protein